MSRIIFIDPAPRPKVAGASEQQAHWQINDEFPLTQIDFGDLRPSCGSEATNQLVSIA
jgi:hypothetical protein